MGLVHSYKKGEVPASKVSKAVKDAAKSMDTKSVKKYASTKHKGKPEKVNKEFVIKKIRELLDSEMESCGYTMSAKDPSYKLKSPGGTGDEDRRLKEVVTEGEKEKIEKLLIKYGNTPEDAKQMISKTYDYIKKAYRNANASKKAEIMSGLMKFETTEDFGNLVEKCWKGYMIHPKRKTKKLFGKTYPNCVKKENVNRLTEMDYRGFIKYMNDFYGPKGIYPDKKKRTLGQKEIGMAYSVLLKKKPNFEIGFDSTDREMLRDILIKMRKLDPNYSKKESVNEKMRPAVKKLLKQKGYGPIFQAIDNSKRQFKQMRYSRGEIQDTLIDMFGKEDPKILQKIKENLNEAVSKSQAQEIMRQLGGRKFEMLMGVKSKGVGKDGLILHIGRNPKKISHIIIDLDRGKDLYNITFGKVFKFKFKIVKKLKGVGVEQMHDTIEKNTGLLTTFRKR